MPDYAQEVYFPDYKLGDLWRGATFGPVDEEEPTPSLALARVRMHFVKGATTFRLDSDSGQSPDALITIEDPVNWKATIPELDTFLPSTGDWKFDVEFYETGKSKPITLYKGTLKVNDDVTKDVL